MQFSKRKGLALIAGVAAAALALSACSSGGNGNKGGNGDGSGDGDKGSAQLPGTGWVRADRDKVADGGKLTLAIDEVPSNWNLYEATAGTVSNQKLSNMFLPTFITTDEKGGWKADPRYAESVELTSKDPQVVTIKINPKATWSDGTPISVDDFKSTWKSLNGVEKAYAPSSTNIWQDVKSIDAGANAQEVKMTFAKKNADWASALTVWPKWVGDTPEHFNTSWKELPVAADGKTIVSGGPYIVTKYDKNGQVITFGPNPKWWGDKPKLDTIIFKVVSRQGLAQAYKNKEIDVVEIGSNADNFNTAKSRADGEIERSLGTNYNHVTLNGTVDVFKDVNVRQAFAKSLNRELMAQARLKPIGAPSEVLNNLIFLNGQEGYEDDSKGTIAYDLEGAKKQLDDAGWKAGSDGIRTKDGKKLTVRFVIDSDNPVSAASAKMVQKDATAAGFDLKIDTVPAADFFSKYVTTEQRDFDAVSFAWQGTPFPISSVESIFYPADSGQNFPGVTDESLGKLWDDANSELDPAKRLEIAKEIDKKIVGLATTIPLFAVPYTYGVKKGLVNYGPAQFETVMWENVGFTK